MESQAFENRSSQELRMFGIETMFDECGDNNSDFIMFSRPSVIRNRWLPKEVLQFRLLKVFAPIQLLQISVRLAVPVTTVCVTRESSIKIQ
jgi:hypothetical protein